MKSGFEGGTLPPWRHPAFRTGAREMMSIAPGISAWGLVTGVAMVKVLGVPLSLLMSMVVFAGSAQLAALPLIAAGAPVWVVWATALCVNLRFVIFSAQWRPYFAHLPLAQRLRLGYFTADLNYVLFMKRFPEPRPSAEQLPYFWGGVSLNWFAWQIPSVAGILLGERVPTHWGLGFAVPSSELKHVVERFSLADDKRHLNYEVTIEDPIFLQQPLNYSAQWEYNPDLAPSGMACDTELAQRYLRDAAQP